MHCFFSPLAEFDLEEIGDYIASDNPRRAVSFVQELRDLCLKMMTSPEAFPLRRDLGENIRMCPFHSYLIFYTVNAEELRIERILHGARDIPRFFDA
ncbi:type II toxin-antitoxin system RelE/ParE family toxin [uncultured Desulfosarcina sp.]|uniref:type II toxin-antitoxin system RelE/ParE family toxin n=1 Tax=uncultured Desulfosarcina sp. TaxID=218289 RepID=UPI0029C6F3CE|nr:type II toxin-antitoxin system RelE/ParE family toxin [uncultured Desulfosarcina sp.]